MSVSQVDRQQAIEAFAKVATPEQSERVEQVGAQVTAVVAQAQQVQVRNQAEAEAATEFLSTIAAARKRAEEARKFLVGPLNSHVKAINERVKAEVAPLEEADAIIREKVLAHRREADRLRQEEQARLDREAAERARQAEEARRAEEARARADREAAAREAAREEARARQAERERREQMEREASEVELRISGMSDDALRELVHTGPEAPATTEIRLESDAASRELDRRRQAREAQERAAAARQREEEARAAEQAARDRPLPEVPRAIAAPAAPLRSASGRAAERKVWRGTVVDESAVPREYLVVNQSAINAAVRKGARQIPGVLIGQVDELAVRAS